MTAADIMTEDAEYVSLKCSYRTIVELLNNSTASVFPLVDAPGKAIELTSSETACVG